MSFSSKTKNDLSRMEIEPRCCLIAELAAIIRMSGTIQIGGLERINIKFTTENAAIARRIFTLLKKIYNVHTEVMVRRNRQLKKKNNYLIIVNYKEKTKRILEDTCILTKDNNLYKINYRVPTSILQERCCKRAYIRGAFLGGGSISDPEKTYHLEFVTHNEEHGKELSQLINSFGLNSKMIQRKEESFVIYLKEGEQIVDLLNIIGAHSALLKLEDIRILKEVRNNINRIVNCETANLSKTINAAIRQIKNIEYIDKVRGIDYLPDSLVEIARLRITHKEASLKELGEMLNPPVGKSGVNHRLRKIEKIAERIKKERGEG